MLNSKNISDCNSILKTIFDFLKPFKSSYILTGFSGREVLFAPNFYFSVNRFFEK